MGRCGDFQRILPAPIQLGNQFRWRQLNSLHTRFRFFFHSAIYNHKCAYINFKNSTSLQLASAQWSLIRLWHLENEEMEALC
jgi:hypothetical protein